MRLPQNADMADRLARLLTVLASAYLFFRVGAGLVSGVSGDPALACAW